MTTDPDIAAAWRACEKATSSHAYLRAKRIDNATGLRVVPDHVPDPLLKRKRGMLAVPIRTLAGDLASIQYVAAERGRDGKYFKAHTKGVKIPSGACFVAGELEPGCTAYIAEGLGQCAAIERVTDCPALVSFGMHQLKAVAIALHEHDPTAKICVVADAGEGAERLAEKAAEAVDGKYVTMPLDGGWSKNADVCDLAIRDGDAALRRLLDTAREPAGIEWPVLRQVKDDLPPAPVFDADALLPGLLRDFVLDEAERLPCPPDFIAAPLIVALGAVIGARCALRPKQKDPWITTPNFWGMLIGAPSESKKSPAQQAVFKHIDLLARRETAQLVEQTKTYEVERMRHDAQVSAIADEMRKAGADETRQEAAERAVRELIDPVEPTQRRLKTNDATPEKLGDLLSVNPAGILTVRDELMGLIASWEKEGNESARAFYMEGWNGTSSFDQDRIGRGSVHIPNHCLSVFGSIQPDPLARYLSTIIDNNDNDGRIQRFQVAVFPEPVEWKWVDRAPPYHDEIGNLFDRLAASNPARWGAAPADEAIRLPHLHFDSAAQQVFIEWSTDLNVNRIRSERNPLIAQHLGKFEKLFASIALVLHLAEGRVGPVRADTAQRAVAWCRYLEGHARRIYALAETPKVSAARALSQRIKEGKLRDGFTARDVARPQRSGITTTAQAEAALAVLEDFGWIVAEEDSDRTGRPTTRYLINPRATRVRIRLSEADTVETVERESI